MYCSGELEIEEAVSLRVDLATKFLLKCKEPNFLSRLGNTDFHTSSKEEQMYEIKRRATFSIRIIEVVALVFKNITT